MHEARTYARVSALNEAGVSAQIDQLPARCCAAQVACLRAQVGSFNRAECAVSPRQQRSIYEQQFQWTVSRVEARCD